MLSLPNFAGLQRDVARTPQRRRMLSKMGQAQRFLLVENVPRSADGDASLSTLGSSREHASSLVARDIPRPASPHVPRPHCPDSPQAPRLKFRKARLAASAGASVAELNKELPTERALQAVFDALSASKSGIVDKAACDARRSSYEAPDTFLPRAYHGGTTRSSRSPAAHAPP